MHNVGCDIRGTPSCHLPKPNIKLNSTPTPKPPPPPPTSYLRLLPPTQPPSAMGNCLKPEIMISGKLSHEEDKTEEAKPLAPSTMLDQVALTGDTNCKKTKKVRFEVQPDSTVYKLTEPTMRSPTMMKGVRVKVVLTQSELKQILNRATIYHHPPPLPPSPPSSSTVDYSLGQTMVKCRRVISRRSSVTCRCSWNPNLHAILE
ncbi:hypothetical protein E3N88_27681 [Mikania micrantha]|uniref:Uncharacterized protein n=1 Tax=Mikania micrantha TaxID=192012 RepID=A0A5N6MYF1_9ASTR|nr:hypothetical protein E3N88_27681 [Mikania micrantha]